MKRKRLLSIFLCMFLCFTLLPATSLAAETDQFVVIGNTYGYGITLNASTPYYVNWATDATSSGARYNAYFDAEHGTLYLNGLKVNGYYKYSDSYFMTAVLYSNRDLTISLSGTNQLINNATSWGDSVSSYQGIQLWSNDEVTSGKNYNLTITSENNGKLNVSGPTEVGRSNTGIQCSALDIHGSAKVNVSGGKSTYGSSYGVSAKSLNVSDGASLNATSSDATDDDGSSMGISIQNAPTDAMVVTDNASVKANSGYSGSQTQVNCGIYTGTLTVSKDGNVEAYGSSGYNMSAGIYARGGIVKLENNAAVKSIAGEVRSSSINEWNGSRGIICMAPKDPYVGETVLTGGSLTATGNNSATSDFTAINLEDYDGVYAAAAAATVDGSEITPYDSQQLSTYKYLDIKPHTTHEWSTQWTSDDTHHWHECEIVGCSVTANDEKDGYAGHTYDQEIVSDIYKASDATFTEPAKYYKSCVCGVSSKGTASEATFTVGSPVESYKVTGIKLNKDALTMTENTTSTLEATIMPENAKNKEVIWKSSDTNVASISSDGTITALNAGTATITCTAADGSNTNATCIVTVTEAISKRQSFAAAVSASATKVTITWTKIEGADGYYIYGTRCGSLQKKIKTIKSGDITKWTQKKLKKGAIYNYTIRAFKKSGSKIQNISSSIELHIATPGSRYTNAKRVKTNFSAVTLDKGKTKQIKASIVKENRKKPLVDHLAKYRYVTSDKKIATVSAKGKIKAAGKGICYIYVYANNGVAKKIRVVVK